RCCGRRLRHAPLRRIGRAMRKPTIRKALLGRTLVGAMVGFTVTVVAVGVIDRLFDWKPKPDSAGLSIVSIGIIICGAALVGGIAGNARLGNRAKRVSYGMLCGAALGFLTAIVLGQRANVLG